MINDLSTPYAKITISTETGMINIKSKLAQTNTNFDYDVLNFQTNRDLNQDCATFSLTIVYRNDWYERIGSNDLVIISMARPPEPLRTIFIGLVDDIRKTTDYSSGKPTRAFRITGRNMNKALVNFDIGVINKVNLSGNTNLFFGGQIKILANSSPKVIISEALKYYIGRGCNYEFANGKQLWDYMEGCLTDKRYPGETGVYEVLKDASSFASFQGNLWTFLKEFKNAPFNEMFWEIGTSTEDFIKEAPGAPSIYVSASENDVYKEYVVFRPTPFNKPSWERLNQVLVHPTEVITESLGRSDLETYTIYDVSSMTLSALTSKNLNGVLPFWYKPYYKKYGARTLNVSSRYLVTVKIPESDGSYANIPQYAGTNTEAMLNRMMDVANWNVKNPQFENGTISVKGSNRFKIATRLYRLDTKLEYYIEGVSHTFDINNGWITNLSLTRGIAPDERFTSPWGEVTQMTPQDGVEINTRVDNVPAIGNDKGGGKKDG